MIFNNIILKKAVLILSVLTCLISCRYKDNDKFVIATVKQRIEKTWYLKEYILNDVALEVNYVSTLKIEVPSKKLINIDRNNSGDYTQYLFDSKSVIKYKDANDSREIRITKLTKDELWFSGYPMFSGGNNLDDKIIAKYSSKP